MDLHSGEHVIFEGHPSWRSILGFYIKGLLGAAAVGGVVAGVTRVASDEVKKGDVALAVIAVIAIVIVAGLVKRISTTYTISNQRLYIRRGLIARKVQETRLDRVQNVNTRQSAFERLLQVGTVDFDTAGSGDFDFSFDGVSQPEEIPQAVDRAQREAGLTPGGVPAAGAPAPPPPPV